MENCPKCSSPTGLRQVIYGLPDGALDEERFEMGGCCVSEKDPTRVCKDCGWEGDYVNNIEDLTWGY